MSRNRKLKRDAFTFSLGGMSAKSSYVLAPAIAHDRINSAIEERLRRDQEDQPDTDEELSSWGRFWIRGRRRAA